MTNLTPDTIDWTPIPDVYKFTARDKNGKIWAHKGRPEIYDDGWGSSKMLRLRMNDGHRWKRGTCDWRDSLVQRPEGV